MSYGFRILNEFGEVLIDNNSPCFQVTQTGTLIGEPHPVFPGFFRYTIPPTDALFFFRLPGANDFMARGALNTAGQNGWESNRDRIEFFLCQNVRDLSLPSPTGYGMVVYDASGNILYRADRNLAAINEGLSLSFDGSLVQTSREWFCIPNPYSGIFSVSGGTIFYDGTAVVRVNGTHIKQGDSNRHASYPPYLVLTA